MLNYFYIGIILVLIDSIYLNIMKKYFEKQVKMVQNKEVKINFWSVFLCYILIIFGLNYFIIEPKKTVYDAFLLGIIIYGVFETTNYAIFKNWSFYTVVLDTLWGGILFAFTTYIIQKFVKI
jgi:uncharacterized membrane protein